MSRTVRTATGALPAALLALAALTGPALAKAPRAAENPTLEDLYAEARKAEAERIEREKEQKRDPYREAIENYRNRVTELGKYQDLVDIILEAKNEKVQPYRLAAAEALVLRFGKELEGDPEVRAVRRQIGLALVDLLKASKTDEIGLQAVGQIFLTWWRTKVYEFGGFKPEMSREVRAKFRNNMKKYLEKEDR